MKKKMSLVLAAAVLTLGVTACGAETNANDGTGTPITSEQTDVQTGGENTPAGYLFESDGFSFTADMDMAYVLENLGEPTQYYEAASCAFEGLDKTYTYQHFVIETYPNGDQDLISVIALMDDLISTPEGLSIGMSKTDMESCYGTDYEMKDGMCVYTKDGMELMILLNGDVVESIQYNAAALD